MKKGLKLDLGCLAASWASRVLPAGAKGLWEKHLYLDQGPDGCFMSSEEMAVLLGGEKSTVESYRQRLVDLGLLRKGLDRGVRRNWFVCWPERVDAPPIERGKKVPTVLIQAAARRLDAILIERGGWPQTRTRVRESTPPKPDASPGLFSQNGAASEDQSRTGVRVGGSGGSSIEVESNPSHLSGISGDRRTVQVERNNDRRSAREGFTRIGNLIARADSA